MSLFFDISLWRNSPESIDKSLNTLRNRVEDRIEISSFQYRVSDLISTAEYFHQEEHPILSHSSIRQGPKMVEGHAEGHGTLVHWKIEVIEVSWSKLCNKVPRDPAREEGDGGDGKYLCIPEDGGGRGDWQGTFQVAGVQFGESRTNHISRADE